MNKPRLIATHSLLIAAFILATCIQPQFTVSAAPALELTPLTWNVVGLDSNNVAVGPNNFPVGLRVCNTADEATNLTATFEWDDGGNKYTGDDYINLRTGSLDEIFLDSLGAGTPSDPTCTDFYFEVSIKRDDDAYENIRRYHIDVTADGGISLTSPQPREIFIEHLISQNRNSTDDVILDSVSIPAGGSMTLVVGNSYNITLESSTATQGYEQLESYLNFPNTIFQINSVTTTHSAVPSPETDLLRTTKPYADGCSWENDPDSPNYLSCLSTGKYGGTITVSYDVTIIGGAGTTQTLNSLIYDFSGSSFHYNADFSTSARIVEIVGPSDITIQKQFVPDTITPGGTSTLMITLTNPTGTTIDGVNFEDTFPQSPAYPGDMVVAAVPNVSLTGCGSGTLVAPIGSGSVAPGAGSIAFSNGSIAPNSTCVIKVDVTVPSEGSYTNTTEELYIDTDVGTGNTASADLTAAEAIACIPDTLMVEWIMDPSQGTGVPPAYWYKADNVGSAVASIGAITSNGEIVLSGNPANSWETWGYRGSNPFTTTDGDYVQFAVDTSNYSDVIMDFDGLTDANGPEDLYVYYDNGTGEQPLTGAHYFPSTDVWTTYSNDFTGLTNTGGVTLFRIYGDNALNNNQGANLFLDNIEFTGCSYPDPPPTISKEFLTDPIPVGGSSVLRFSLDNTDPSAVDLTGVTFTDILPDGLQVDDPASASTTCAGSPTWAPTPGATILTFGDPTGATMLADSTCTAQVRITATSAGTFDNVSGYISSNESGENTGSGGYATDSLTAIAAPQLSKDFAASTILTDTTTVLTFTLTNPNQSQALSGMSFIDDLPGGLTVEDDSFSACGGTVTVTSTTPPNQIRLLGGSLAADSSCSFDVTVTGDTVGTKNNVTTVITSNEGGNGEAASATLYVKDPSPKLNLLKQIGLTSDPDDKWTKYLTLDPPPPPTNVYYKFTVENTGDVDLSDVSVTDPTLTGEGISLASCTWSALTTADPLEVCVVGPLNVDAAGKQKNTATGHASYGDPATPIPVDDEPSSSAEYATTELTLVKSVTETYFVSEGDELHYSYEVMNSGYAPLEGPVSVSDDKVTVSCPDVNTVGDNDAYLDPADYPTGSGSTAETLTCTVTYTVTADDVDDKVVTNTASASAGGVTSEPDSETVYQAPDLAIIKTNGVSSVDEGGSTTYTIRVTNNGPTSVTGAILSDPAASGLSKTATACSTTPGQCVTPPTVMELEAGFALPELDVDQFYEITVTADVTAAGGTVTNTATVDPPSGIVDLDTGNNSASDMDDVNLLPIADNDTDTATEGGPDATGNVLTNETSLGDEPTTVTAAEDDDGDPLTLGTPFPTDGGGTLTINSDGTYTYSPPPQGSVPPGGLTEVFTYTITDDNGDTSQATLTITIGDNDLLPIADDDTDTATEGGPDATGNVLTNETSLGDEPTTVTAAEDDDGDPLTLGTPFPTDGGGALTINSDGSYTYTPPPQGSIPPGGLTEVFTYTITDDDGDTDTATLTITVGDNDLQPIADDDMDTATEGGPDATGNVLTNETSLGDEPTPVTAAEDDDGDPLTLGTPFPTDGGGTLTINSDGSYTYTPPSGGVPPGGLTEVFTYTITDEDGDTSQATLTITVDDNPSIIDPPFGEKTYDDDGFPIISWTMVWINTGDVATNAAVSDPIPAGTTYVTAEGVSCTSDPASTQTTTSLCTYEGPTPTYPRGRIVWEGVLGPDAGASNASEADDELYIQFSLRVDAGTTSVENIATIDADLNGDEDMDDPGEENAATVQAVWQAPSGLPDTGFAPGVQTVLPSQPEHLRYSNLNSLWLEVPDLRVYMPIVGIPQTASGWDVTWLWSNAGYLNGTAFPTWEGNTGITGHVTLPSGVPGPFADLKEMGWGDEIILHAWGNRYVYQVQTVNYVRPNDLSVLKHEDRDWITLITCHHYDERLDRYHWRLAVRAVLVSVEPERR